MSSQKISAKRRTCKNHLSPLIAEIHASGKLGINTIPGLLFMHCYMDSQSLTVLAPIKRSLNISQDVFNGYSFLHVLPL